MWVGAVNGAHGRWANTELMMAPESIIRGKKSNRADGIKTQGPSIFMFTMYVMYMDIQINVYLFAFQFITSTAVE